MSIASNAFCVYFYIHQFLLISLCVISCSWVDVVFNIHSEVYLSVVFYSNLPTPLIRDDDTTILYMFLDNISQIFSSSVRNFYEWEMFLSKNIPTTLNRLLSFPRKSIHALPGSVLLRSSLTWFRSLHYLYFSSHPSSSFCCLHKCSSDGL